MARRESRVVRRRGAPGTDGKGTGRMRLFPLQSLASFLVLAAGLPRIAAFSLHYAFTSASIGSVKGRHLGQFDDYRHSVDVRIHGEHSLFGKPRWPRKYRLSKTEDDAGADGTVPTTTTTMLETVELVSEGSSALPFTDEIIFVLSIPQIEIALSVLVLLSSAIVAVGTLQELPPAFSIVRNGVESGVTIIFLVEFFLRFYAVGQCSPLYLKKPLVVVDLLVVVLPVLLLRFAVPISAGIINQLKGGSTDWELVSFLPSWLMSGSALINLRLLRILRLQRVLTDLETFTKFEVALGQDPSDVKPYQLQLARVVLNIFTSLSVTSGLIYTAEKGVNPMITDYFSSLYFTLITLTTVGYGDIAPVTGAGRVIVCLSILGGVAIIPAQLANLVEALLDFQDEKNLARRREAAASENVPWDDGSREEESTMKNSQGRPVLEVEESRRFCMICGAGFHRSEAIFCWKCGAKTLKNVPAEVLEA